MRKTITTATLAAILWSAIAALAGAVDVPVSYDVDDKALRSAAPAGTIFTLELHALSDCSDAPVHTEMLAIESLKIEALKVVTPKGATKGVKTDRLTVLLSGVLPPENAFLKVTGNGVTPVGGDCQAQILSSGLTGEPGAMGPAGAMGATGAMGPAGAMGATGAVGPAGAVGATGAMGLAGATGDTGAMGATGPSGIDGASPSQRVIRWAQWSSYDQANGWIGSGGSGDAGMFGGVTPQSWGDGNGLASSMSSDAEVMRTIFNRKLYPGANAVVVADTWVSFSSTNSRHAGALMRIKNVNATTTALQLSFYATCSTDWSERASASLNGTNDWQCTSNTGAQVLTTVIFSIPPSRTSTLIVIAGSSTAGGSRTNFLAFADNSLTLPAGLSFVDDLEGLTGSVWTQ